MKKIIKIFSLMLIISTLLGCSESFDEQIIKEVDLKIEGMSLREKIAQMLIVCKKNSNFTEEYFQELKENQVGGFIIFDDNITNYKDTKKLINDIYNSSEIPMFIAVDQEGGKVKRLSSVTDKKATDIPDMKIIGDKNDENLSYSIGTIIGEESRSLGVNIVFAPVLDVGNYQTSPLKKRLLSSNPNVVSNNGIKIAEGINNSGVIPVYKHFPGIANTEIDSHEGLPIINKTLEEMYKEELIPFIDAIENEYYKAEMIMIGHANYPKITNDDLPSSISKEIVNNLLRNEIGYNGVVVTDAINMDALTNNYNEEEIFELGINASVDIFLMPSDINGAIDTIEKLVNENRVSEEQINESVKRILILKKNRLENFTNLDELHFGSLEHKKIVDAIK